MDIQDEDLDMGKKQINNYNVLFLKKMTALEIRIRNILESHEISLIDFDNEAKLLDALMNKEQSFSIILLDIDLKDEINNANLISNIRKSANGKPIIILTSTAEKRFFVEAILQGATDFVIKPFDNQMLITKIFKYLVPENTDTTEFVTLDLYQYLKGELRKAEKGHFPLTIMFLSINNSGQDANLKIISFVFENIKDIFWDTDVFIRFLRKYYLGVFPFCDEKNKKVIEDKIAARFNVLKEKNEALKDCSIETIFVTYPYDTEVTADIYELLISRVKNKHQAIHAEINKDGIFAGSTKPNL